MGTKDDRFKNTDRNTTVVISTVTGVEVEDGEKDACQRMFLLYGDCRIVGT